LRLTLFLFTPGRFDACRLVIHAREDMAQGFLVDLFDLFESGPAEDNRVADHRGDTWSMPRRKSRRMIPCLHELLRPRCRGLARQSKRHGIQGTARRPIVARLSDRALYDA